jgi:S1-C subfamily serine protease/regulator of sirC expression with transglutaminase-like and TPR domain
MFRSLAVVAAAAYVGVPAVSRANDATPKTIYAHALKATLMILTPDGRVSATGWVLDRARRLAVTNHHVVADRPYVQAMVARYERGQPVSEWSAYAGKPAIRCRVVDTDPTRDLALLELASLPPDVAELPLAADSPSAGDRVHSIGNPLNCADGLWIYSSGYIRTVLTDTIHYPNQTVHARVVVTQSPINPGDSGGPIVNDAGELVAVTSGHSRNGNAVSYGIEVHEVRAFVADARKWLTAATADEYWTRGVHYLERHRFAAASDDLTAAISRGSKGGEVFRLRAAAFAGQGRTDPAIADLVVALQLNPLDAEAMRQRCRAYLAAGRVADALADAERLCKLTPDDATGWNLANVCYYRQGKFAQALEHVERAIKLNDRDPVLYHNRGLAEFGLARYREAVADHTLALDLSPKYGAALQARGRAYEKLGEAENAKRDLERARELDPKIR